MSTEIITLRDLTEYTETQYRKAVKANKGRALKSNNFISLIRSCFATKGVDIDDPEQGSKWYKHILRQLGSEGGSASQKREQRNRGLSPFSKKFEK